MTTITLTENDLTRYDAHERMIFRAAADVGIVAGIGKLNAAGHPARREAVAGAVDAHRKRIPAELRIGMKARAKGLPERLHKLCAWLVAKGPASEAPTPTIDDLDDRRPVRYPAMSAAEKVAKARAHVDAGELDAAAALVLELAIADRDGDIGYVERMRWHETMGALDRAGVDLRTYFVAHGEKPPQVGPLVPPPAPAKPESVLPTATTPTVPPPAPEDPEHYLFVRFHVRTPNLPALMHELEELVADGTLAEALMTACGWRQVTALVLGVEQGASEPAGKPPTDPTPTPEPTPKAKRTKRAAKAAKVAAPLPADTVGAECDADADMDMPVNPTAIQAPEVKRPAMTAKATKAPAPEKLRKSVHKYVTDRIGDGGRVAIDLGDITVGVHEHACIFAGVSSPQAPELSWGADPTKVDIIAHEARRYLRTIREQIANVPERTYMTEPLVIPAGELPRDEEKRAWWIEQTQARIDKLHRISIGAGTRLTSSEKQTLRNLRRAVRKLDSHYAHTYKHAPFDARLIEAARKALLVPAGEQGAMSWAVGTKKPAWIQWSTGGVLIMPLSD